MPRLKWKLLPFSCQLLDAEGLKTHALGENVHKVPCFIRPMKGSNTSVFHNDGILFIETWPKVNQR